MPSGGNPILEGLHWESLSNSLTHEAQRFALHQHSQDDSVGICGVLDAIKSLGCLLDAKEEQLRDVECTLQEKFDRQHEANEDVSQAL